MQKSYCRQCVFYKDSNCSHHENTEIKDTWLELKQEFKRNPDAINRENNCNWFKPMGF